MLIEIFLEGGSEFTAIVLDVGSGSDRFPVVLLPTEVCFLFSPMIFLIYSTAFIHISPKLVLTEFTFQKYKTMKKKMKRNLQLELI